MASSIPNVTASTKVAPASQARNTDPTTGEQFTDVLSSVETPVDGVQTGKAKPTASVKVSTDKSPTNDEATSATDATPFAAWLAMMGVPTQADSAAAATPIAQAADADAESLSPLVAGEAIDPQALLTQAPQPTDATTSLSALQITSGTVANAVTGAVTSVGADMTAALRKQLKGAADEAPNAGNEVAVTMQADVNTTSLATSLGTQSSSPEVLMQSIRQALGASAFQSDADAAQRDKLQTHVADSMTLLSSVANHLTTQAAGTQTLDDVHGTVNAQLNSALGSAQWPNELASKLVVLAKQDTQAATLHVTPADLGPVKVRIETQDGQTNVWFTAAHADTRTALEQALPKLREMFDSQGLQLQDAGVFGERAWQQAGQQAAQQQAQGFAQGSSDSTAPIDSLDEEAVADTATVRALSLNMVDAYV